jgi:hypothetical protein
LRRSKFEASLEQLEERRMLIVSPLPAGDVAVLDLAAASTNTTGSVLVISPSTANQAAPARTISIASTGPSAMRFSDSGTSSFLSDTSDQSLLAFAAYNTTDTTDADLANSPVADRAVGTLNPLGGFTLQTTYTGTKGNQARSATSLDDTNWFVTDKGGLYTNGATTPSLSTNILDARSFGGTVYVSSTKTAAAVSTASSPTASSLTGLSGVPTDGSIQDFYLIQSGAHGSTYDILYTLDQNSGNASINKFSLVSGTWLSNGSVSGGANTILAANAGAMIAENDGAGGAYLFVTTTKGTANNSLARLTDTAGYNQTISIANPNNVTLYTDTTSDFMKGLDFVPASATVPTVSNPTSNDVGASVATLGGTVTSTGTQPVTGYGVVYSLTSVNSNPAIGGTGVAQLAASGAPVFTPFTVGATGLQGTYSFAAYASNSAGTAYSSVASFTTQSANPPTIDTPRATSITSSSATLGGTVESDGGATVTKSGVVYALTSVNGNPQLGGTGVTEIDTASPVDSGAFTVSATGLSAGAGYTFEAFATNSSGTTYTTATSFTTLAAPTVNSPTVAAVTSSSATLGATVASDGGSAITTRGIVYAVTSVNSNPQLGGTGVTELDTTGTTGSFTIPVTGLSGSTGYTFEAFATNGIGTTYTTATSFNTVAANVIAAWTFPVAPISAPYNSPAPTFGSGTATSLGMTNNYTNASGTGNTTSDDILSTSGTADPNFTENLWRIRGTPNNGWAQAAPQYSQGIELDTSTVGYSNIVFAFNWYSTTQGIRDLQVQYNTGSGWVNYQGPSPTGTFLATSNDYYNAGLSPVNPTIYVNLSGVAAASNNPDLGIRLVSAYDSTGILGNVYASATSTPGDVVPYNNSSGNWRFGNLIFYGNSTTTSTTVAANPPEGQSPGQNVTFTATVTPASGSQYPTGTVAFYDGSTQIGTTQPVTQVGSSNVGTASITLSTLSPGVHGDITAQYTPAGSGFLASGSSMSLVAGDPTDNPISYVINAPQATGVDVSPVAGQSFTGVVATFSDGTDTNPAGFAASITWANGQTTPGSIAFTGTQDQTNINGQVVPVSLFTVTGTYTYAAAGTYPLSVTITDPNNNKATVTPTARVAYPALHVTAGPAVEAVAGTPVNNQTVATFTDPGLVANLAALNITDPTTQFSASINWGDGSSASAGTIAYNSGTQIFSVAGSHTYSQTGPYDVTVSVTPLTVAVERIDSSDPTNLNLVGDENGDGLTDSPSPDFIDQYVIGPTQTGGFATGQSTLYTTSLPDVSTTGGNEALTNSSYSVSEGELSLSTNGQYLVTGGYNDTVSAWAPQQTFSPASFINRVIGTIDGQSDINTTTDLTDAYSGDNFRGVTSTDGTQFWTAGHSSGASNDYVHYATLGATTSMQITGAGSTPYNPSNINRVEIFNGQLYETVRSTSGSPAGIFQIGNGLPKTAGASGQSESLFIEVPQTNPLDVSDGEAPMTPFDFWMTDLPTNPNSVNGVNVAYVADAEMGIARYDYTGSGWQFSYYIDQTGSFLDGAYTVDSQGNITPTNSFNANNPAASEDPSKVGGVRGLTGRVVDGQVELFAVTGFGIGSQPAPGGSVIEVADPATLTVPANGLDTTDSLVTLATNPSTDPSELTDIALSPTAIVTSSAQVYATPIANSQSDTLAENATNVPITLTGTDPNTPALPLTYTVTLQPAHGTLSGTVPNLTYTPNYNYFGPDSFQFTDNNGYATSTAATVSIKVVGTPTANPQVLSLPENVSNFTITLTGSDPNSPALPLSFSIVAQPSDGTLSGSGANISYTPNPGFAGLDSFQFDVSNGTATSVPRTVNLTVSSSPAFQANADSYSVTQGGTLSVNASGGILANDTGSPLTIVSPLTTGTPQTTLPGNYQSEITRQVAPNPYLDPTNPSSFTSPVTTTTAHGGTVTLYPDGSFNYVPPAGYTGPDRFRYSVSDAVQDSKNDLPILATFNGGAATAGGYGSSLYPVPGSTDEYYGLEDRGPNATAANGNIVEPLPNYNPAIGEFLFQNGQAILERYIPLTGPGGTPFSGRVNSENPTGETLVDLSGNVQPQDPFGEDSEGLVAMPDGSFYVSDEYGPYIIHFDSNGAELGEIAPAGVTLPPGVTLLGTLPAELQNRLPNRGMEGLTVTPDGTMLVGMMQSALNEPDIGGTNVKKIDITRLITYQLVAVPGSPVGTVHEYLYQLDNPGTNATANSELTALDDTHFVVDERDGNFPDVANTPYYKKLWEIDITGATDVGPNSPLIGLTEPGGVVAYDATAPYLGLTIGGKSLEDVLGTQQTSAAYTTLTKNGIIPVSKGATPYLDVGALISGIYAATGTKFYSHDKIEGVAYIPNTPYGPAIVVSNDSDFNVGGVSAGSAPYQYVGKNTLNPAGIDDDGEFLIIYLDRLSAADTAPTSTATVTFNVMAASPTITSTASPAVTLGTTSPTLSDSAVLANGYNETGNLVFTLTGPNGFIYTQDDPLTGNGTYTASDVLPTVATVAGTYTWHVSYAGDPNNNSATDQGGTAEQTVVSAANPTITTTPSPNVTLGTTAPTLNDSAVLADGYYETGNLVFTLTGPNGFSYTQSDTLTGNGTYTASDSLPTTGTVAGTYTWHVSYAGDPNNNSATDNGAIGQLGDVFYIDMENHNLTQPSGVTSPQALEGNPAAPYLNSLMTAGNPNAAQTSWASNYYNVLYNNPAVSIHPSEPNYIWQEGGSNYGEVGNDDDPYANNGNPNPNLNNNVKLVAATGNNPANLSGLLQAAGIPWKSYQEDIDLSPSSGTVNQPGSNALTSTVASQSQWTVPTTGFSGTSAAYTNAYNGSHQYNFAVKHDGTLFYTDTNGGTLNAPNFSPSNPEAQYYAPLQQLATDLTNNTVARYNLITPDQYNDMHSSLNTNFTYNGVTYTHGTDQEAVAMGDNFLSQIIPQLEASQAYKNNGAIVIWYDETEGGNTTQFTVPEIIISPLAKGNAYNSTQIYTHSSDLKTLEEAFHVPAPGGGFLADANTPGTNDLANMFKPEQTVVSAANPTITSTASPVVTLGTTSPTLSDSAVLAGGYYETGNLVFTLTGPNGFSYTQDDPLTGNGTYTASDVLPTVATVAGTYTWHVSYAGDPNNNSATDQGGTAEQTVVSAANPTITTTPSPNVTLGTTAPTLSDSAVLADGYYETGNLVFTLTGPNGFSYTQSDTLTGNGTYTASDSLPTTGTVAGTYTWHVSYAGDPNNNSATDNGAIGQLGDVFYIDMENHNLTQPSSVTSPQALEGNPAAPYLNSLMTAGNPNAAQTSWASNYYNVLYNNPAVSIHPSEPNYIWQEGGSNYGEVGNDDDPYANNGNPNPNLNNNVKLVAATGNNPANLSGLLQAAGIPWKSYQEDIDLSPSSGTVNQPGSNALTSTVASSSQWTVPTASFSGTSAAYTNAYNGSHQYNFAVKHDGTLFYTDTNGGTLNAANFSPSNPEAQYYAPLQQLATDLTNNTVARYNLITPDQYNDMHSSLNTNFTYNGVTYTHNTDQEAVAMGDNFLSQIIPQLEASQAYKNNGAIVIWYDETEGGNTTQFTVPEIIISPLAKGNAYNSTQIYTHSSDLKTLEEAFNVPAPGGGFLADANTPGTNDLANLFKPEQTVVSAASPTITSTASPAVTPVATGPTLTDSAVVANGYYETGNLAFTLTGPNGFSYTQTDPLSGNGTYTASDTLPTTSPESGVYTWHVSYAGDPNNNGAVDQGGTTERTVVPVTVVSLGAIATNPRNVSLASEDVTFSEPINLTNFNYGAFNLSVNGGPNLINGGVTISLVNGTTDTYRISGLTSLTTTDGTYVLTVNAADVQDLNGVAGTGTASVTWLMDTTPPTSKVNPLPTTETSYSFTVSVTGSDPAPASEPGIVTSGVASYAIYVAIDNGPFALWTTVPASNPSATYTGQARNHYYFRSVATDLAGNVESKPVTIEAATYVPDLTPPVTKVTSATINTSTDLFTLNLSGTDSGPSGLATFDVFVQVDPGSQNSTIQQIATVAAGSPNGQGVYSGVASYQVPSNLLDGQQHTYRFFSEGVNGDGTVEAPHAAPNDVESVQTLSPQPLAVSSLVIEKGLVERSYVRYIDIGFNQVNTAGDPVLQNLINNGDIRLIQHPLSGVISTSDPIIPLTGLMKVIGDASGNADIIEIDFGALGLGGVPAGAINSYWAALEKGDGYYELDIDSSGSNPPKWSTAAHEYFYRLLGDVNGDHVVNNADLTAITAATGQSGPLLNADVNGDGTVNITDKQLATKSLGIALAPGLHLDD